MKKILIIFLFAFLLRVYGINWDQGNHLHPDERFLTMVTADIQLPTGLSQYFDTNTSPLNPENYSQYHFFIYGTFPIFLVKIIAVIFNLDNYDQIVLLGRALSALFDSFNIILLYYLSRRLYWPSIFYALTVLPIQLSHFYTVDTFVSTFLLATFTLLSYNLFPLAALTFGLALSSKISAIYFAPIIVLFFIKRYLKQKNIYKIIGILLFFLLITFVVFRLFQPYAFSGLGINPIFTESLKTLKSFSDPSGWYPPSVQWMSKTPLLYSLQNIVFFGFGLPLFTLIIYSLFRSLTHFKLVLSTVSLSLIWIIFLFLLQGSQFAHTMRYFLPIYPFLVLVIFLVKSKLSDNLIKIILVVQVLVVIAFMSIYSVPQSRVQASQWIYQNIPSGSNTTTEYWDDPLPLNLPGYNPDRYNNSMLPLYDPDTDEKWHKLNNILSQTNYLFMSSNRLWGSIPLVPSKYPQTSSFYQQLFDHQTDFKKVLEINSYPGYRLTFLKQCYYFGPTNFPYKQTVNNWFDSGPCVNPGIYFRDDTAEEAFTVYDHPKVLIFQRF